MWSIHHFDVIVETLTGSEFEVTVTDGDTIGFIKSQIQRHEGECIESGGYGLYYWHYACICRRMTRDDDDCLATHPGRCATRAPRFVVIV